TRFDRPGQGRRSSRYQPLTGTIIGPTTRGELRYSAYAPVDAGGSALPPGWPPPHVEFGDRGRADYLELPARDLPRLIPLAREVAGLSPATAAEPLPDPGPGPDLSSDARPSGDAEMARRLVRYLRDEGGFTYSLDLSIEDARI